MKPISATAFSGKKTRIVLSSIFLFATLSAAGATEKTPIAYTKAPVILHAKNILPTKLLKGKNYSVKDRVENDGLINIYRLSSKYGPTRVESTDALMIRIAELNAMTVMEEMDRKNVFGKAVVSGVKAPVQGVVNLVTEPVETTKGIVTGTGRFLSNIGRSITSDDPHQDNPLKVALGYDGTKRAFAYEFGINPYSGYEPVVSRLGEIARASVAGGLLPKAALAAVDGTAVAVVRISGAAEGMRKLVRDNPPGELEKINRAKLEKMGIPQSLIDTFMNNYSYDPQEKTYLVGELERFQGVAGREHFIEAACTATQQSVAGFFRATAQLMAGYHTRISSAAGMNRIGTTPYLRKKDGGVVIVLPLDYIFWTGTVENKLQVLDAGVKKVGEVTSKELWLTGKVDANARKMLKASGWNVTENVTARLME